MISKERRGCKRFILHHPVLLGSDSESGHLAEIIDAGVQGMRVRMTNQSGVHVGEDVHIACVPLHNQASSPIFRCRVTWEDTENLEVGLKYLQ